MWVYLPLKNGNVKLKTNKKEMEFIYPLFICLQSVTNIVL